VSSRTARATQRNPVLKNKNQVLAMYIIEAGFSLNDVLESALDSPVVVFPQPDE
jgi:hypothetical protein